MATKKSKAKTSQSSDSHFLQQMSDQHVAPELVSNRKAISRIVFGVCIVLALLVSFVLYQRTDRSYTEELDAALAKLTAVDQGKVTVTAKQSALDATIKTSFLADSGKQQQIEATLEYSQDGSEPQSIRWLDVSNDNYVELPLAGRTRWVALKEEDDQDTLRDLGYPVDVLIGEDAHTPLLPFGNFEDAYDDDIKAAMKHAFSDAVFVRADEGELEYQVEFTMQEVVNIIDATARSAQPMDITSIVELFGERKALQLTVRVDRDTQRLVSVKVVTSRDGEDVHAVYEFNYDQVELETEPTNAISASKYVDLFLKQKDN